MQEAQTSAAYENAVASELDEPQWAVVSFERCEASGLTFTEAVRRLAELETAKISGLCIVTDETAARVVSKNA